MHTTIMADQDETISKSNTTNHIHNYDEETRDVDLISIALEGGLYLINSMMVAAMTYEAKKKLEELDIVRQIVRMVELVLEGFKYLKSNHLKYGINIVAALLKEIVYERRNDVVRVFQDFMASNIVDDYDSHDKMLLLDICHNANTSTQT